MAENPEHIPTLAELALKYGTISRDQHRHLIKLHALAKKEKGVSDWGEIILEQKMATAYQVGLLVLLRDYHIIRRRGEEFGKIAVKKGFATKIDIQKALDAQKAEFKKSRLKKLMGDILVESGVITAAQKKQILKEQTLLDKKSKEILDEATPPEDTSDEIFLSEIDEKFLRVKGLDREFSAAVLEKGLATQNEVRQAEERQEEIFHKTHSIKILGDIMVSMKVITTEQKNLILEEQDRQEDIPKEEQTPEITIVPTADGMAAWAETSTKKTAATSVEQIHSELADQGISQGIYPDALLQCWLEEKHHRFPVARKDNSVALQDARNLESIFNVNLTEKGEKRKGDLLIRQDSTWNIGKQINIFNKPSSNVSYLDFTISCGSGTRIAKDKSSIVASKSGIPALSAERILYIHPIINVPEDADQRYGPLEPYAKLTVRGTITGAYPVTGGDIWAREIRGGIIEAVGNVRTSVGITEAVVSAQGDIHARYLHNCNIETYGNVYVENEIFDSVIRCSGKFDSPNCRIINSEIYAKEGVILAGAGSDKTGHCKIVAGGDHHIVSLSASILSDIEVLTREIKELKEDKSGQRKLAKKTFREMVELKIFHDRAKKKKQSLVREFKKKKNKLKQQQSQNILTLISQFDKRMEKSIFALRDLNQIKKRHDEKAEKLDKQIKGMARKIAVEKKALERRLFAALECARSKQGRPEIKVTGKVWPGTVLSGIYSSLSLEESLEKFTAIEQHGPHDYPPVLQIHSESISAS